MKKKVANYSLILLCFVFFTGLTQAWKENRNPFGIYSKTKIKNIIFLKFLPNDRNKVLTNIKNYPLPSNISSD